MHCLLDFGGKNSISILLKTFSILLNSTKHVLRILHALFHLMKNKIQVKENLQGCGVKIKILTLLKEKKKQYYVCKLGLLSNGGCFTC